MEGEKIKKGIDFYLDKNGLMVFTKNYLLNRGSCCKSFCKHCPYGFKESLKNKALKSNRTPF